MWGQNLARTRFPAMVCTSLANRLQRETMNIGFAAFPLSGRLTKGTAGDDHHDIE